MNEITTAAEWADELDRVLRERDHPDVPSVVEIDGDGWNGGTLLSLAHSNGAIGGVAIGAGGEEDELVAADETMAVRWNPHHGWFEPITP